MSARRLSSVVLTLALAARAALPPDAETFRLRSELLRVAVPPATADWRLRLDLESGLWSLRGALARHDGETGAASRQALWLGCRLPAGWRLGLGSHRMATELGAALGRARGGLPPRLAGRPRLAPGSASTWQPEERALSLRRECGPLQGGLLLAATRRDLNSRGDGFLLDMPHTPATARRVGAWRDRLALAWLDTELPAGWELRGLAGWRGAPTGGGILGGARALRLTPRGCLGLAWEGGESRVALLQGRGRWRSGWWQADAWRGLAGTARFSRPALSLGRGRAGGGQTVQVASRLDGAGKAALSLALRRLDATARGPTRPALWWRWQLERALSAGPSRLSLRVTRSAAEDRPAGSGREAWRVELEPVSRQAFWRLAWEERRGSAGGARLWHLRLRRDWSRRGWKGGAELHLLSAEGAGPGILEALALGPGLLRHAYLNGGHQAWGGGLWLERGGQRLALALLTRETGPDAAGAPESRQPQLLLSWRGELR